MNFSQAKYIAAALLFGAFTPVAGIQAEQPHPQARTLRLTFRRCARGTVAPRFTG